MTTNTNWNGEKNEYDSNMWEIFTPRNFNRKRRRRRENDRDRGRARLWKLREVDTRDKVSIDIYLVDLGISSGDSGTTPHRQRSAIANNAIALTRWIQSIVWRLPNRTDGVNLIYRQYLLWEKLMRILFPQRFACKTRSHCAPALKYERTHTVNRSVLGTQ